VALVAAELSTPVDSIEAWPTRKFLHYHAAVIRLLKARNGKK